ncbi:unnamed protein product [Nyctereutes procyonoides]|uniref:(raccoon dog) hypothetical protein n=1 Tax=Nyctereutes procyonoides TaxID=34880 RepID=A0A811YPA9_NYCPR|nr:unnamed protein product [Nyctereutes procyonoides]CAD7688159.1 unnamed protein product [Nyctereutes procyonoides]
MTRMCLREGKQPRTWSAGPETPWRQVNAGLLFPSLLSTTLNVKTASNKFGAAGQENAENVIQQVVLPDGQVTTEPCQTSPRKMYKLHMKFYSFIQCNGGQGTYQLNTLFQHIQSASRLNFKFISARIIYSVNLRVCMTPTRKIQKKFLFCSLDLFSHKTSSVVNNSNRWGSIIEGLAEKW